MYMPIIRGCEGNLVDHKERALGKSGGRKARMLSNLPKNRSRFYSWQPLFSGKILAAHRLAKSAKCAHNSHFLLKPASAQPIAFRVTISRQTGVDDFVGENNKPHRSGSVYLPYRDLSSSCIGADGVGAVDADRVGDDLQYAVIGRRMADSFITV